MIIDISRLLVNDGASINIDKSIEIEPGIFNEQDIIITAPVKASGDIKSISGMLYLTLGISAKYTAKCSRCLADTAEELDFTINEVFSKPGLENENDEVIILDSNEIDLQDIIVQALSCALPITSLCSENCKGFCPECGCNLNVETCNCEVDDIDPRLAVLKDFLK
ncbi:MAG: DUF177 domain-containing protein [Clostridia bacterium]|nr:DUF177 domain-containing protein [Clostridia bacterium]MBO7289424.1 DUF177 domain-containing protein [Clostridia bacterium]